MPTGPKGEKRPADVIGSAVRIAQIATGEAEETESNAAKRMAGKAGSKARAVLLTPERRKEIATTAAQARWKKKDP